VQFLTLKNTVKFLTLTKHGAVFDAENTVQFLTLTKHGAVFDADKTRCSF